jgi:serine/threonine protein kinase/tetratricopeptide (TPR) repeat protein
MVCPTCGLPMNTAGLCSTCGGGDGETYFATGVLAVDTTGLPPGATRAPGVATLASTDPASTDLASTDIGDLDTSAGTGAITGTEALTGPGTETGAGVPAPPRASRKGPLRVGQAFSARYHIIKLLGAGGMGAVYQAWDEELGVAVALKVIRQDSSDRAVSSEAEKQFKNELLLARQVTHKNVVRIHDLGEIQGIKYITMPYVQGDDLASDMRRDGRLPVPVALRVARQVAAGLQAAHEAGVVHRDLKPANIMITRSQEDVHAQIMDFGISASTQEAMSGGLIGTLEYMAPEQGAGLAVDARADIYAFGLILYEMLAGPRPLTRRTPQQRFELMQQRCRDGLPSIRSVEPSVPAPLDAVVMRCLEREPAARFQTTHDLVVALTALDDYGELLPIPRKLTPPLVAASVAVVAVLLSGTYYVTKFMNEVAKAHEPVSVVIADFENRTPDPAFNRTLEPMLRRALEGAGFISAYDRNAVTRTLGMQLPDRFNDAAAKEVARKQGLGVVLAGFLEPQGSGYRVSMNAAETVSGKVVVSAEASAATKQDVLEVANKLVTRVRSALGDSSSESQQMNAMVSLSTTNLDVVRHYADAQDAAASNKFELARDEALQAVKIDPKFGIGYQLLAVVSRNLGNTQESEDYIKQAYTYVDSMTERERYSTRGFYYRITGDYQKCVSEYGQLIARYAADVIGHNQRALCLSQLREMKAAVDEMRSVVAILPKRVLFRDNLALYRNYATDFAGAEKEVGLIPERDGDVYASLALAFSQLGQGRFTEAATTYEHLSTINALGASFATMGLGDLAALQGRFGDAVRILRRGAEKEAADGHPDRAAAKLLAASDAELARGNKRAAIAAAQEALAVSKVVKVRFLAARTFIEAGDQATAKPIITDLGLEFQAEPQAYGKILEGDLVLKGGDPRVAVRVVEEANKLLDTWIGHFYLGRAYLQAGRLTEADSEFDRCLTRRGEALSLFLDEEPTFAFLPAVYYYQGLVREGLKTEKFADSYRAYLAIRGTSREDPLVPDVQKRAAGR